MTVNQKEKPLKRGFNCMNKFIIGLFFIDRSNIFL
jgi:hypothetical protein